MNGKYLKIKNENCTMKGQPCYCDLSTESVASSGECWTDDPDDHCGDCSAYNAEAAEAVLMRQAVTSYETRRANTLHEYFE